MSGSHLVPPEVLPNRRPAQPVAVRLERDRWESSEGRLAPAVEEGSFPPIGDVLPEVRPPKAGNGKPSNGHGQAPRYIALGLNADIIRKQAQALGSGKLTLLIPLPDPSEFDTPGTPGSPSTPGSPGHKDGLPVVKRAVCVCPSDGEGGVEGVGVIMPLEPKRSGSFYAKVRAMVVEAERRL
ncbi:MAG: hypothetical protein GC164_10255 [Phycisphaera sp.]|nr:hypothetical protein [Phycisphaera sp.]